MIVQLINGRQELLPVREHRLRRRSSSYMKQVTFREWLKDHVETHDIHVPFASDSCFT